MQNIASASGQKAKASIRELIGSAPKTTIVKKDGNEETVNIDDLKIGDIILVKAGQKIPVGTSTSINSLWFQFQIPC